MADDWIPEGKCPLCHGDHETCIFTANSMICAKPHCKNPHHRKEEE